MHHGFGNDDEDESTVMIASFSEGSFFADRYHIQKTLGTGAMGRVYAATELHSGRPCAIKVLHKERLGEEETVARFQREAEVLASIGHPCIVEIYAFHHAPDGSPYLAMELLEGMTLKERLREGPYAQPQAFQAVLDGVCGALDAAHERGVVHRDMKPDNLFLPTSGTPAVKIVDFGLSRIQRAEKDLTHSGMILGTPRYMAPEQIRDASSSGPAGDLYSLAVLTYEAISGKSPYPAQDYGQLLGCVLEARTTPLVEVRPDLGQMLSDVLARATAPEPANRFQSCGAFAAAFGHAIGSESRAHEIKAATPNKPKRPRNVPSLTNLPVSKGSTLAFDAAAVFGDQLPDPDSLGSDPWDDGTERTTAEDAPEMPSPSIPATAASFAAQTPSSPPPATAPAASSAAPAQGGDTLFLGDVGEIPPPAGQPSPHPSFAPPPAAASSPYASQPGVGSSAPAPQYSQPPPGQPFGQSARHSPAPQYGQPQYGQPQQYSQPPPGGAAHSQAPPYGQASAPYGQHGNARASSPSHPQPAPAKKSRTGLVLFLVALVVVVAGSAAAGFGLRAHMRGELDLPFEIPGVTPAEE